MKKCMCINSVRVMSVSCPLHCDQTIGRYSTSQLQQQPPTHEKAHTLLYVCGIMKVIPSSDDVIAVWTRHIGEHSTHVNGVTAAYSEFATKYIAFMDAYLHDSTDCTPTMLALLESATKIAMFSMIEGSTICIDRIRCITGIITSGDTTSFPITIESLDRAIEYNNSYFGKLKQKSVVKMQSVPSVHPQQQLQQLQPNFEQWVAPTEEIVSVVDTKIQ